MVIQFNFQFAEVGLKSDAKRGADDETTLQTVK